MGFPVIPITEQIRILTAIKTSQFPATLTQAKCKMYKNEVTPDVNSTPASFVECDFDGYGSSLLVMSDPSITDQGLVAIISGLCSTQSDIDAPTQTVYGIYITNFAGDQLIAAQRFDEPQQVGGPLPQSVSGVWRMSYPPSSYGWIDVEN